jgi:conjugative relaxase-like TrwC/TraI family protein
VRHRTGQEYRTPDGATFNPVEHRAGWDATFSAPKSVSLTALVGGDNRVRAAHREAVTIALTELERYTQARIGGNNPAETTGKFIAAKFEHDNARPVDGYAAPQLHSHAVIFNMTERADGSTRALQERGFFDTQQFATAVYQSELTFRLRNLGYQIEAGKSGAPDIKGYTPEYLEASSPRRQQIEEAVAKSGFSGPEAAQIAAHNTRDKKDILSSSEVLAGHRKIASEFGNQADRVVAEARERAETLRQNPMPDSRVWAQEAVKGEWKYLYRAVDKAGNTVDFLLRTHRDKVAARRFFEQAIDLNGAPEKVTIDKSGSNAAALEAINAGRVKRIVVRQVKYLNNIVEQDHRAIKRRTRSMLGFKDFRCARILLSGIELMHMIRKGQMRNGGRGQTPAQLFYSLAA